MDFNAVTLAMPSKYGNPTDKTTDKTTNKTSIFIHTIAVQVSPVQLMRPGLARMCPVKWVTLL